MITVKIKGRNVLVCGFNRNQENKITGIVAYNGRQYPLSRLRDEDVAFIISFNVASAAYCQLDPSLYDEGYLALKASGKSVRKAWLQASRDARNWALWFKLTDPNKTVILLDKANQAFTPLSEKLINQVIKTERFFNLIIKGEYVPDDLEELYNRYKKLKSGSTDVLPEWVDSLCFKRIRSFKEVKERLSSAVAYLSNFLLKETEVSNHQGRLLSNGMTVVVPKDNLTLVEWGYQHNHCVGSYGESINQGEVIVAALFKNGVHLYTISWTTDKKVEQIMGPNNVEAPSEIWKLVEEEITFN